MLRFLYRRLLFISLVTVLIIFSAHLGMRLIPNSEGQGLRGSLIDHAQVAWSDSRAYLDGALLGELGTAQSQGEMVPVVDILKDTYSKSMALLALALAGAAVLGIYLGSATALTRFKQLLLPVLALTVLGVSLPSFFASLLLRQAELEYVRIFGRPLVSVAGFGWDYEHMLLPTLVLAARPFAYLTRASYLAVGRIMEEDFIRTAFSKGLTRRLVVNIHAIRNVAVPLLTAVGVSLRFSLGALPIVEFFFLWPGMGLRLLQAINLRQTSVVVTLAAAIGLTFLGINLLLDLTYRFIDPRLRGDS